MSDSRFLERAASAYANRSDDDVALPIVNALATLSIAESLVAIAEALRALAALQNDDR